MSSTRPSPSPSKSLEEMIRPVGPAVRQVTNTVRSHPLYHRLHTTLNTLSTRVENVLQPLTDRVVSRQTQESLRGEIQRMRGTVGKQHVDHLEAIERFVTDLARAASSLPLQLYLGWLVMSHVIIPLMFVRTEEAEAVFLATTGAFLLTSALHSRFGIRPLLFAGLAIVEVPLLLYLVLKAGIGGRYAYELAIAIEAAQQDKSLHHHTIGGSWYMMQLWHRTLLVGIAATLPTILSAVRKDIAKLHGTSSKVSNSEQTHLQDHGFVGVHAKPSSDKSLSNALPVKLSDDASTAPVAQGAGEDDANTQPSNQKTERFPVHRPDSSVGNASVSQQSSASSQGTSDKIMSKDLPVALANDTSAPNASASGEDSNTRPNNQDPEQFPVHRPDITTGGASVPHTSSATSQGSSDASLAGTLPVNAAEDLKTASNLRTNPFSDANTAPEEQNPDAFPVSRPSTRPVDGHPSSQAPFITDFPASSMSSNASINGQTHATNGTDRPAHASIGITGTDQQATGIMGVTGGMTVNPSILMPDLPLRAEIIKPAQNQATARISKLDSSSNKSIL